MSSSYPLPAQSGHYFQGQHVSGSAKVHFGDVYNSSELLRQRKSGIETLTAPFSTGQLTQIVAVRCSSSIQFF
jgi:hypothetical protein